MTNILLSSWAWFGNQGSLLEWLTAIGTVSASFIAIYFGAIRPIQQRAKFIIYTPIKSIFHSYHHHTNLGKDGDMVELGFFVEQISGTSSSNVNILVKKVWYCEEDSGNKMEWNHFIPSNLRWAADNDNFSSGVKRYCHLGWYGDHPGNDFVDCVFDLLTTENRGDPVFSNFSSMLPDLKKYEIELVISGENVQVKEFKIELVLNDQRALGPIGDDGLPVGASLMDSVETKIIL